ncbi:MAG: TatD family hydrolase [Gallionella sp.]|nr:TatD family hydrolase [Gallionella sp.]MDD4960486.1 TatD family hydrolase [Gallionella sp.]
MIDTHCHLDAPEFGNHQAELIQAAHKAGVHQMVIPAVEVGNFAAVQRLCAQYPSCFPAYGIHPMYVARAQSDDLAVLRHYLTTHRPVAVGEIGLDGFVASPTLAEQESLFIVQLKLAREFDLPVLLHIRHAQDQVLKHLRQIKVRGGIAHAFNGSRQQAEEFIKLGFKLGFGGAMTYPRALQIRQLAATLPLDSLVLETDAPDIPPVFLTRSEPNQPAFLPKIAQALADLRGMTLAELTLATRENTLNVLPYLNR